MRKIRICAWYALILLCLSLNIQAEEWLVINKDGSEFTSDNSNHRGYRLIVRSWKDWYVPAPQKTSFKNGRKKYNEMITRISNNHNLSPALVHAVISVESAYNPNAISPMGATGLMQLMPATAKRFGVENRKDPEQNISGGVKYLKNLIVLFDNDLQLVLAGYNAGENAVKKYNNTIPPYAETQKYVKKVLNYYNSYKGSSDQGLASLIVD